MTNEILTLEKPEHKVPALQPNRFAHSETVRLEYVATVPAGVPFSRVLDPDYWAHVAPLLRPWYRIEVRAEDGAYFGELVVRKAAKESAHCWVIRYVDLESQVVKARSPIASDFKTEFGGAHKWRIVRLADGEVMHKGEASQSEAEVWLSAFLAKA